MKVKKCLSVSLLMIFSFQLFAQTADEAAKEKHERESKLIEQILGDAKSLRLPENRALVFARAGSALWSTDEKRARKLFADAVSELIAAQTEVGNERAGRQYFQSLFYGQSPRADILALIGARDAETALEMLVQTRPAVIVEAMQTRDQDPNSAQQMYARNEIAFEQRLAGLAAEQNPETAVRRVRESIKKGISGETLNLLRKIYAKNPQIAEELAAALTENLLGTTLTQDYQTAEMVGTFIAEMSRPREANKKSLKIPDALLRRLITKMTDELLSAGNTQPYGYWSISAAVEKLLPERAAQFKKRFYSGNISNQNQSEESSRYSRLLAQETKPEAMLAEADKFQPAYRAEIYRGAAMKYAAAGNLVEAETIIRSNMSADQAPYFLAQIYLNHSYPLAAAGKFAEANAYLNRIEDEYQRAHALINLANSAYEKNPKENRKLADEIFSQARALIPVSPENQNDINSAIYLSTSYLKIDPDESFRILESLQPVFDELVQANFTLAKYRNYGAVRQNEMLMANGNNLAGFNIDYILRALKEKDFERALRLANGFARPETRIWLQLQMIDENVSKTVVANFQIARADPT